MIGSKRVSGGPRSGTFLRAPERLGREYGGGEPGQRGYRDVARRSRPDSRRVEDGLLIRGGFCVGVVGLLLFCFLVGYGVRDSGPVTP